MEAPWEFGGIRTPPSIVFQMYFITRLDYTCSQAVRSSYGKQDASLEKLSQIRGINSLFFTNKSPNTVAEVSSAQVARKY